MQQKKKLKPIVFMSHVHKDANCAKSLVKWVNHNLNSALEFFITSDPASLKPGSDWTKELRTMLTDASLVLSLISPNSLRREWIHFEAGAGYGRGIRVIPVCWGGIRVEDLTPPLSILQALNIPGDEKVLLRSVAEQAGLNITREPTILRLPAFSSAEFMWKPHS